MSLFSVTASIYLRVILFLGVFLLSTVYIFVIQKTLVIQDDFLYYFMLFDYWFFALFFFPLTTHCGRVGYPLNYIPITCLILHVRF